MFFFILTYVKLTVCVCVCAGGIWRVIGCYWFSFQCDCAVETEIQAQVGSDLRLGYCVCHDEECAVYLWDVIFCNCFLLLRGFLHQGGMVIVCVC